MRKFFWYIPTLCFLCLQGCMPPQAEKKITDIHVDFTDEVYRKIHMFQDQQLQDSLFRFFRHKDPTYRYLAALAFASIRDSSALDSLAILLKDDIDLVRAASAYAIGQTGATAADPLLVNAFDRNDTIGHYFTANRAILEAIGKCGSQASLKNLSTIKTYQTRDTQLLEGQALGIYRFALRNITAPEGTARMLEMASNNEFPGSVRLIAAHYLQRAANITVDSTTGIPLIAAFKGETNPDIRMALAMGLGKVKSLSALETLKQALPSEKDARIKYNILRALASFDYEPAKAAAFKALRDGDDQVAGKAAAFFVEKGNAKDAPTYWALAKDSTLAWPVQITLFQATLKYISQDYLDAANFELRQRFFQAATPYQRAIALQALAELGWNYRFIQREGFGAPSKVIKSASVDALAAISNRPDFNAFFGSNARKVTKDLAAHFRSAILSGDAGMAASAANALRNPARGYKSVFRDSTGFLQVALAKLKLPDEIETYNEIKHTISFFNGEKNFTPTKTDYNHPINWERMVNITASSIAEIVTDKGVIKMRLLPEEAPGTVANFVQLAREGFYTDKVFHRVVPNFVIQGGCPRGDGYGSLDFTIRSELPPLYYHQQGCVGMASAGNHTEGTQFFITHSPTPHLDGNYTIFALVVEGMDVVNNIRVGDKIKEIRFKS